MLRVIDGQNSLEGLPGTPRHDLGGDALLTMAVLQSIRTRPGASALERARVSGRSRPVFRERHVPPRIA